jgi:membrane protease YdiL (CAAX protease family)
VKERVFVVRAEEFPVLYLREEKKITSKIGFALLIVLVVTAVLQIAVKGLVSLLAPQLLDNISYLWLSALIPQYVIAYPIAIYLIWKLPKTNVRQQSLNGKTLFRLFLICYFVLILGSVIGSGVNKFLEVAFGIKPDLTMDALLEQSSLWIVFMVTVILAPIFEELIFRKLLLDRLVKYGEFPAVIASGLLFGFYHGNFSQLFYAIFIGCIFAYIYVKTGKVKYCIFLHMTINFVGSVLPTYIFGLNNNLLLSFYGFLLIAAIIAGGILAFKNRKFVHFSVSDYDITNREGSEIIWLNPGMILAVAVILLLFVLNLLLV